MPLKEEPCEQWPGGVSEKMGAPKGDHSGGGGRRVCAVECIEMCLLQGSLGAGRSNGNMLKHALTIRRPGFVKAVGECAASVA